MGLFSPTRLSTLDPTFVLETLGLQALALCVCVCVFKSFLENSLGRDATGTWMYEYKPIQRSSENFQPAEVTYEQEYGGNAP
jgi:hypothetical protein